MAILTVPAGNGGALSVVNGDGTVHVVEVPTNATVTITPQKGFGDPNEIAPAASLEDAVEAVENRLGQAGAV